MYIHFQSHLAGCHIAPGRLTQSGLGCWHTGHWTYDDTQWHTGHWLTHTGHKLTHCDTLDIDWHTLDIDWHTLDIDLCTLDTGQILTHTGHWADIDTQWHTLDTGLKMTHIKPWPMFQRSNIPCQPYNVYTSVVLPASQTWRRGKSGISNYRLSDKMSSKTIRNYLG